MKIKHYSCGDASWQPGLQSVDRDELFEKILDVVCTDQFFELNPDLSREGILQALIERETLRTTAMGDGIAFPHARLENLNKALFSVCTLKNPVIFGDQDTHIVCLILVPASDPSISLKIMAYIARVLGDAGIRTLVMEANTPKLLEHLFTQEDESLEKAICARDIMQMPRWSVNEHTTVSECAKLLSNYQMLAIPVLNDKKQVVGEITADLLFRYGLPDFFTRLKSVSFVSEFDPFEKYFEDERNTQACEIMSHDARVVPPEHTMMEIVFDLAIRHYPKLYVVDENKRWIGVVTKGTILDNVINI